MRVVFENTGKRLSHSTQTVEPYINSTRTHLPVEVDEDDKRRYDMFRGYGTPVPVPDGMETTDVRALSDAETRRALGHDTPDRPPAP